MTTTRRLLIFTGTYRPPTLWCSHGPAPPPVWVTTRYISDGVELALFNVAIAAFGVVLADVRIANSNALIMLGALNSTLALFLLQISLAYALMVFNNKDLSKFESDINAHYSVTTPAIINNFIQVINPGPITAAVDTGLNCIPFLVLVVSNIAMVFKGFHNDDDYVVASIHLFWGLYGLFICIIKAFAMLSCVLIISSRSFGIAIWPLYQGYGDAIWLSSLFIKLQYYIHYTFIMNSDPLLLKERFSQKTKNSLLGKR
ncbi:hypothetical protein CUMW_020430 [Citrus unshiu]|nr:hypothetical protein CUMW_020430 [Citrus unshiu]